MKIEGGFDGQRAQLAFAIREVDRIFADPVFWQLVQRRQVWLRAPERDDPPHQAIPIQIDGVKVHQQLHAIHPAQSDYELVKVLYPLKFWYWVWAGHNNAVTSVCGTIKILRANICSVPAMINTVAHENTHLIGMGDGPLHCEGDDDVYMPYFQDGSHTPAMDLWLVSYTIGDLAQCFYESKGDADATEACMKNDCRVYDECCATKKETKGSDALIIKQLRSSDPRCGGEVCSQLSATCSGRVKTPDRCEVPK